MTDTPDSENPPKPDDLESLLGGLDFTPNWAKGEPGVKEPERRERSGGGRGAPNRGPRAPRDSSRRNLQGVRVKPRRDQPSRGPQDRGEGGGRGQGPQRGGPDRPYRNREDRRDSRPPRAPRVPVHVDFIPEKKRLSMVVKVIRQSHKVFPLRVVAEKFMENPAFIAMKYTVKDKVKDSGQGPEEFQLYVCRANGMVFTDEQACIRYVINHGIDANYESTSKEVDPPAGNFVCIGRHRPSGRLIGPPNWHGYQSRLADVKQEVGKSTPFEHFTADIEMVHEEEVIEAWKKEVSTQTFYREKLEEPPKEEIPAPKEEEVAEMKEELPPVEETAPESTESDAPADSEEAAVEEPKPEEPEPEAAEQEAAPVEDDRPYDMTREQVEAAFREKYLKRLVGRTKRTILPGYLYNQLQDPSLRSLTDYHLRREHQRPNSIIFALRPAFKHMRLHVYRYDGDLVVSGISQHPLPSDQKVAPEIQNIVDYVAAHPGCNTQEALKVVSNSMEEIPAETVSHFRWLIEKGHLLEFHDDTLHLPHEPPKSKGGGKGKGRKEPPSAEKNAEVSPAVEEPPSVAPETPVAETEEPPVPESTPPSSPPAGEA